MKRSRQSLWRVFAAPIILAILSIIGLISALLGDDWHDFVAWVALIVPILVVIWAYKVRRS